jgi:uncharacterized protein
MANRVIRQQDGKTIAHTLTLANNMWLRLLGLMGKANLPEGHALWITPCSSVHSCFMRFAFDAVFVDKAGRIVHIETAMAPWRVSPIVKGAKAVIELPQGTIATQNLKPGDLLVLK